MRYLILMALFALLAACNLSDPVPPVDGRTPTAAMTTPVNNSTPNSTTCTPSTEICDGVDNDCDQTTDEGCDDDQDGFCDGDILFVGTPPICPMGGGDCDDTDAANNPMDTPSMIFLDRDGDGYGEDGTGVASCSLPPMRAREAGDCNDSNDAISPGAMEICDNLDNNCDGAVDEGCDDDGDDYCEASIPLGENLMGNAPIICPLGGGDCDDDNMAIHPGADEVCDDVDNDCSGQKDEVCDLDGDGYCEVIAPGAPDSFEACMGGAGDCDDSAQDRNPGAPEVCGVLDANCDGVPGLPAMGGLTNASPGSFRADHVRAAASDMGLFGVAWAQQFGSNTSLSFALLNATGAYQSQVITLSPARVHVSRLQIAWEETSKTFAIAYIARDPETRSTSLFFTRVDTMGSRTLDPVRIDSADRDVRLIAKDGLAILLYDKVDATGNSNVYHVAYDVVMNTMTMPVLVVTNSDLTGVSVAQRESLPRQGGLLYLVWRDVSSSEEYTSLVLYADDGSEYRALQRSIIVGARSLLKQVRVHAVGDHVVLSWADRPSDTNDYALRATLLNEFGFPAGSAQGLGAGDASTTGRHQIMPTGADSFATFFEPESGNVKMGTYTINAGNIIVNFIPIASPIPSIAIDDGTTNFFTPADGKITHLSQANLSPSYFSWYAFDTGGMLNSSVGVVSRPMDERPILIQDTWRDAASGEWRILYSDQSAPDEILSRTYSPAMGLSGEVSLPSAPRPCSPYFEEDGVIACVATELDPTPPCKENALYVFTFEGMRWTTSQYFFDGAQGLIGAPCVMPAIYGISTDPAYREIGTIKPFITGAGECFVTHERYDGRTVGSPDVFVNCYEGGARSSALAFPGDLDRQLSTFHIQSTASRANILMDIFDSSRNADVLYRSSVNLATGAVTPGTAPISLGVGVQRLTLFDRTDLRATDGSAWALVALTTSAGKELVALNLADDGNSTVVSLAQVPAGGDLRFISAEIIGEELVVVYEGTIDGVTSTAYLQRLTPMTMNALRLEVSMPDDQAIESLRIFGREDYLMLASSGLYGLHLQTFDAMGTSLGEDALAHLFLDAQSFAPPLVGVSLFPLFDGEHIALLGNDYATGSSFIVEATCQ